MSFSRAMKSLFILPLLLVGISLQAQEIDHHMELGMGAGVFNYTGDLAPKYNQSFYSPGVQFFYRHNHKQEVSVFRANILIGTIKAHEDAFDDPLPNSPDRQLSFSTGLTEFGMIYEYNFFNFRDLSGRFYMSPYLFGGLAASVLWGNQASTFLSIPFGAGVKYKMTDNWNLGLEYGVRKTFTDKLDGILLSDEELSSSTTSDWYYFLGLNLSYTFYKQICPSNSPGLTMNRKTRY